MTNIPEFNSIDQILEIIESNPDLDSNQKSEFIWKFLPTILNYIKQHAVPGPMGPPGQRGAMGPQGAMGPPCECNCFPDIKEPESR